MFKIKYLITLFWVSLTLAHIYDYTSNIEYRTFNQLEKDAEGSIPIIRVDMDPTDFEKMIECVQVSQDDLFIKYNFDASLIPEFETKVTLKLEINGNTTTFKKVNFKTGGQWSRTNDKIGFNLKLKGDDTLYSRKSLRLRPDSSDATHIHQKMAYDILGQLGTYTVQTTYVEFYLNDKYFGLYSFMDAIKPNWIKKIFNLSETSEVTTLFTCKKDGANMTPDTVEGYCFNANDDIVNNTKALSDLFERIEKTKTIEELNEFLNVETVTKLISFEFLLGSCDHFVVNGHNYYFYLPEGENAKWEMMEYDFDSEFGNGISHYFNTILNRNVTDFGVQVKFEDFLKPGKKILDTLYFNDTTYFKKITRDILIKIFNPDALFKRIDELVEFIEPYIKKTTTFDENGRYPGVINLKGIPNTFTMDDFYSRTGFSTSDLYTPGIKYWIQKRFEFVCKEYGFDEKEILREAAEYRGEEIPIETTTIDGPTTTKVEITTSSTEITKPTEWSTTNIEAPTEIVTSTKSTITITRTEVIETTTGVADESTDVLSDDEETNNPTLDKVEDSIDEEETASTTLDDTEDSIDEEDASNVKLDDAEDSADEDDTSVKNKISISKKMNMTNNQKKTKKVIKKYFKVKQNLN